MTYYVITSRPHDSSPPGLELTVLRAKDYSLDVIPPTMTEHPMTLDEARQIEWFDEHKERLEMICLRVVQAIEKLRKMRQAAEGLGEQDFNNLQEIIGSLRHHCSMLKR